MEEIKVEMLAYHFADMLESLCDQLNETSRNAVVQNIIVDNNRITVNVENECGIMSFSKDFSKEVSK